MRSALLEETPAKQWLLRRQELPAEPEQLARDLGIDGYLARLLCLRGITNFDQSKSFFRPHWNDLHPPGTMKDMDRAVQLIAECLASDAKILLYGDYDVDGTTSVALAYRFLNKYCSGLGYYIPDRRTEGYGLSHRGIDWAAEQGYRCIVTLDCGTTACEPIAYANSLGLKVIVTDHHQPSAQLPAAAAILNPMQAGCAYPFKDLSGCGVAFKFLVALCQHFGWPQTELLDHLELVAISIAADVVPLVGENRILTHYGLQKLNSQPIPGIRAMLQHYTNRKPRLDLGDVVFGLAPRINAAGRMGDARLAVRLLLGEDLDECAALATEIEHSNLHRRDTDAEITRMALEQASVQHALEPKFTTVVRGSQWHKGVIGIVASRLVEKFYKPTVVFSEEEGKLTGSARSVHGFDLYHALEQCSDCLEQFGGHKYAAGLTMRSEQYPEFCQRFENAVVASIEAWQRSPSLEVDLELPLSVITPKFFRILQQFAPYGQGNRMPLFCARRVYATPGSARVLGQNHLSLNVQQSDDRNPLQAIAFGQGSMQPLLSKGLPMDIAFHLEENHFRGESRMQVRIVDMQPHA